MERFKFEDFVVQKKPMDGLKTFADHDPDLAASTQLFSSDLQKLIVDYAPNPEFRKDPETYMENVRMLERIHQTRWEYTEAYYKFMQENGLELPEAAMNRQPARKKQFRAPEGATEEKQNC